MRRRSSGEASIYHLVNFDITDVLILFPETIKNKWITDALVRYAGQNRCPVVTVNGYIDGCTNIDFDYAASFEKMVRHVVEEHYQACIGRISCVRTGNAGGDNLR